MLTTLLLLFVLAAVYVFAVHFPDQEARYFKDLYRTERKIRQWLEEREERDKETIEHLRGELMLASERLGYSANWLEHRDGRESNNVQFVRAYARRAKEAAGLTNRDR